jgi:predicted acetyltransferase
MAVDIRTIQPDEQRAAYEIMAIVFGDNLTDHLVDDEAIVAELDRYFAAFDGDRIVGTAAAYTFELTVPGGAKVAMGGVTNVGVVATHRRQGLLRRLMGELIDDAVGRGEPMVGLTASESNIYRRFGYGIAARRKTISVDASRSAYLRPPADRGMVRMVDESEAAKALPSVYEQMQEQRPGAVSRSALWWELLARDREPWRDGATQRRIAVHDGADGPDGYAIYRLKNQWEKGLPNSELRIEELVTTDHEVEAALWRFCLDTDLVTSVLAYNVALDIPLVHRMVEPRRLQVRGERDHLWLRLLDVPASLAARRYESAGSIVVEVVDGSRPEVAGRFRLDADLDGATSAATTESADLTLDIADLSAVYLGGTTVRDLAGAGLVDEHRSGAVTEASRLFVTAQSPWCIQEF